ncbi:uncharacterized protein [Choristoneura fumiferana]|uniref:uncharacterized protein n=1 Tax=Choristoneura fumiferana TaxID=7141 RepID=UPI003D1571DA
MSKTPQEELPKLVLSEIPLNVILKFIKPYDGSRDKLNAFINNCTSAISLTSASQESIVLKYIISQLEGKAEIACSIKEFDKWSTLQEFLKAQFGERKHHAHLLTELQQSKQNPNESINQFSLRIESCLSQLLTEVTMSCPKKMELAGRIAAMEDLALNAFILGIDPKIATILRCKSPKTLNEAINIALSENKLMQYANKKPLEPYKPSNPPRKPFFTNARPQQSTSFQKPTTSFNRDPNNSLNKPRTFTMGPAVCRYCKATGHTLEQCLKREYNNRRFNFNNNTPSRPVHFLDEGVDEVDLPQPPVSQSPDLNEN